MRILVAGKGGAGKTTVAGTLARTLARRGHRVLALDGDTNPMLGVSLGLGPEQTDLLVAVREGLESGQTAHEPSLEGFVERFGRDAPDGVRLLLASRIERPDPGCRCCGISAEQLLGELDAADRIVVGDLEAGLGTLARLREGQADVVVVVAQPTAKSLEVARRAAGLAQAQGARVVVAANRVRGEEDLELVRGAVGAGREIVAIPDDPAIAEADRDGRAPLDAGPDAPGVRAVVELAERVTGLLAAA